MTPITAIVLLLHFTIAPLPVPLLIRFIIGAVLITIGLSIFLLGVDIGVSPLGNHTGSSISKFNKLWIIVVVGLVLGFFISIAEPALQVLATEVESVSAGIISKMSILVVVSAGMAAMIAIGLVRIVYNFPLYKILTITYALIMVVSFFVTPDFFAISFDASGATTGVLAVPFIMALAIGVSSLKKDSRASEKDSFGLVAIASMGAILGVLIMGVFSNVSEISGTLPEVAAPSERVLMPFIENIPEVTVESFLALFPIVVIYIIFQFTLFKFPKRQFRRILKGLVYTFIGLILFLTGVNAGFMSAGTILGGTVASFENKSIVIAVGFILGFVTILAEPAVHFLTQQIETVTSGYIRKSVVLGALAIGVGAAIALAMLRIVIPQIQLWHYLLPGYIICIALSYVVPKLFVGIAFDSGGVATGPMTATFILAFTNGVAGSVAGASVMETFGMISLVAMTPIITLQILGLILKIKSRKKGDVIVDAEL